ncbi:MAG: Gx transporter family protein [Treponema sp.]|jgi:heptaprenyl diphosphate synthase|nr:Gx transporter family protein [Treponema sp.]
MLTPRPGKGGGETGAGTAEGRHTLALLGSLCLFLSALEYLIPKPFPFMRIGLANLPLLLALDLFSPADFFLLAFLKTIGQGILTGTLVSYVFLFSLAGTISSAVLMYALHRAVGPRRSGYAGISCAGAMLSNGVQLFLARFFVFGAGLGFLVPPFLASGFASGIALGIFCEVFCGRSRWYGLHAATGKIRQPAGETRRTAPEIRGTVPETRGTSAGERCLRRRQRWNELFGSTELFIAGLIMMLFLVFNPSPLLRVPQFLFFCFLAWCSGKRNNPLVTALVMASIVFFNLLAPHGKILAALGPLRITGGSLLSGFGKALTLEGLVMLSGACVKTDLKLPGRLGALLGESFRLLELMRGWKMTIRRGHIIEGIDRLMLELDAAAGTEAASSAANTAAGNTPKRKFRALLPLAGMLLLAGLPLLFLHYT